MPNECFINFDHRNLVGLPDYVNTVMEIINLFVLLMCGNLNLLVLRVLSIDNLEIGCSYMV